MSKFLLAAAAAVLSISCAQTGLCAAPATPPNIVFILTDDLGYCDVGCYGATKVRTPHIDRLAREGRLFTDAHSPAAVCTATRYAVFGGREFYRRTTPWKSELLLTPGQTTLPSLCKAAGYATALVGKWHLGYGKDRPDWNGELKPGPLEIGFDSFFGTAMTHNEPPQVLVENYRVVNLSPEDPIRMLPPGPQTGIFGRMEGGRSARVHHEDLATIHTDKAVQFIQRNKDRRFFLYYGTINIHGPLTPHKRFRGTSQAGIYGDYIQELDWSVGEVLGTLDRLGLTRDTLVIFSSDNGAMLDPHAIETGHLPNGKLLGQKTDVWEGGHRVPLLVRWPGHVPAGTRSAELISLSDMLATFAAVLERPLGPDDGPDSFNALPAFLDDPGHRPVRTVLTMQGIAGMAIREGRWLLIAGHGSAGYSTRPSPPSWGKPWQIGSITSDYTPDGQLRPDAPPGQLYDLEADRNETLNVYREHPDIVARLSELREDLKRRGRTRP